MTRAHEYHRPESVEQALQLLSQNPGAVPTASGTQLRASSETTIDLSGLPLKYVRADGGCLRIGAMTPLEQISAAPAARVFAGGLIADAARSACSSVLRCHRTLGGVLSADPDAEISSALLLLDADILFQAADGPVSCPLSEVLESRWPHMDAIATEAGLRAPGDGARIARERVARTPSGRAIVSVVSLTNMRDGFIREVRLAASGVGLRAMRLRGMERRLTGTALRPDAIRPVVQDGVNLLDIPDHPIAGADYRRAMLEVLIARALLEPSARESSI